MLLLIFLVMQSSVSASSVTPLGAGTWDTILDQNVTATSSGGRTSIAYSGGGDIRICASGVNVANSVDFYVYSDNGSGDSVDDYVPPKRNIINAQSSSSTLVCFPKIDARSYVDGSNNKAEFYVKVYSRNDSSDTVRVIIQD